MKNRIIAIAGPTASGKTALAVCLAKKIGGEVISNDSMQIYRGMVIGTAAPSAEETCGVPHHMIGCVDPGTPFSCADYASAVRPIIEDITARGHIPVFCGGTGLYLDAVLSVGDFSESVKDDALRKDLEKYAAENGAEALHARLEAVDPEAAAAIHCNNIRRVVRAIEIYETTGITKTEWDRRSKLRPTGYDADIVVLDFLSRELLCRRIDMRVDKMMASGLEDEVRALWENGKLTPQSPAYQAIGYKEFIPYFEGGASLDTVVQQIKTNTRRYSKRQNTWFRRYSDAIRVHADTPESAMRDTEDICGEALQALRKRGYEN